MANASKATVAFMDRGETHDMKMADRVARAKRYIALGYSALRVSEICDISESWAEQMKTTGKA